MPRARRWTDAENTKLRILCAEGVAVDIIAESLSRSVQGTKAQIYRMGIPSRLTAKALGKIKTAPTPAPGPSPQPRVELVPDFAARRLSEQVVSLTERIEQLERRLFALPKDLPMQLREMMLSIHELREARR